MACVELPLAEAPRQQVGRLGAYRVAGQDRQGSQLLEAFELRGIECVAAEERLIVRHGLARVLQQCAHSCQLPSVQSGGVPPLALAQQGLVL